MAVPLVIHPPDGGIAEVAHPARWHGVEPADVARLRRVLVLAAELGTDLRSLDVRFRAEPITEVSARGLVPAPSPAREQLTGPAEDVVALVNSARDGDPDAFGRLYDRYVDLVYRYIYYRVGAAPLAEDLTSETFLRALRRIGTFTWQGRDFGAWLVTIARNLIADHFKSGRYRLEVTTDDVSTAGELPTTEGPEGAVLDALTNATLLRAVRALGAEQQECIVLRFLHGLSVAETALAMGKNEGAIKALQYRAVRSLARLLPEGFLP